MLEDSKLFRLKTIKQLKNKNISFEMAFLIFISDTLEYFSN